MPEWEERHDGDGEEENEKEKTGRSARRMDEEDKGKKEK